MRWPSGLKVGDKLSEKRPTVKRCKQQLSLMLTVYKSVPSYVARLNESVLPSGENAGVKSSALTVVTTGGTRLAAVPAPPYVASMFLSDSRCTAIWKPGALGGGTRARRPRRTPPAATS